MRDLSGFERREIVCARLAGSSVTKPATSLNVSRATVSKVMSTYTNHEKTRPAKRNNGQKSTLTERDRRTLKRIISKNHMNYYSTGYRTVELNIHLKTLFPQKVFDVNITSPASTVGLQLLNL
jgi:IS30 family transposase